MKTNKIKICFIILATIAVSSLKAQSIQQKFQNDLQQRRLHADAVRLKAQQQQVQQQSEKTNGTSNTVQPNTLTTPQQKKEEIKTSAPVIKTKEEKKTIVGRKENAN